jgi:2-oxo-4-hydroxy-4-carboxy-5-ureidoimidazoline decarboxylase
MATRAQVSVAELDALAAEEASSLFQSCCGSRAWVTRMLERRPFRDLPTLLAVADDVWWSLTPKDWREAFAHHPRIGERDAAVPQDARASEWSAREQAKVRAADAKIHRLLRLNNALYERRFGHIYVVCASGKSPDELLAILQFRLSNDPETELRVAAEEQAKITKLRLRKLLGLSEASQ